MDKTQICSHLHATSSGCSFWHMQRQQPEPPTCCLSRFLSLPGRGTSLAPSLTCFTTRNPQENVHLLFEGVFIC